MEINNNNNNNLQNISDISNNTIPYKNNNSNIPTNQYYSKKKNPRDMTVEELEEYIQKNKSKLNHRNNETHSLNTSFTCHYNFGMSEKIDKSNQNTFSVKRNNNVKHFVYPNEKKDLNLDFNKNIVNNNENKDINNSVSTLIQGVVTNTPFIKSNQSSRVNTINNDNDNKLSNDNNNIYNIDNNNNNEKNIYNTFPININMDIPSPTFKKINNTLNYSLSHNDNNNNNDDKTEMKINNNNSRNINNNNYIMQKIDSDINNINNQNIINSQQQNQLNSITDDMNMNININNKEINSNSAINYIKSLQNKIKKLTEENENLKILLQENNNKLNNNSFLKELDLYKNKILFLEQNKIEYMEQVKIEKNNYEKEIFELKKDNEQLKQLLDDKNKEIENITNKYEIERNEFLDTMKSLREIIIQKENEKNILNLKNQKIGRPNIPINKEESNNKKTKNIPQHNIINKKKQNSLVINHSNNLKKQKTLNSLKKNDNNRNKNTNNLSYIRDNKNTKKIKYKTPSKIIKNISKSKTGEEVKKINIKNNLNNNYTYENNNMNINYNFDTNNTNNTNNTSNINNDMTSELINNANNIYNNNNINQYDSNKKIYQQNFNFNNRNKINFPELNSIRSDFSDEIQKLKYNNKINNAYINQNNNNINNNYQINNNDNNFKKINENIFLLERTIPELVRDYKNILTKINTNLFPNDNEKMINNLKNLEKEIEIRKNQLNELKKTQQQLINNLFDV